MCGISGKLYFNKKQNVRESDIRAMNRALSHRGPDDSGIFIAGPIGLGHCRLSIIDLSPAGHQPMPNADNSIWLTFNGEIYNFQELRTQLQKKGYDFKSQTDTEIIIYLYQEYGEKCLQYLRGMFAFAIWDNNKKQLFLARDRIGKKPLKYFINNDFIIFASELKAIITDSQIKKEPDFEAIHHYLTFQYAPTPLTGFKGIKKLPPAHYMVIQENGKYEIKRYWQINFQEKWQLPQKEWQIKILTSLEESVRLRMIADVPLGAFLSGGIDSSAIVGLMAKLSPHPISTFSIGFAEKKYNETNYASQIAKLFKTDHHELQINPNALEILPQLIRAYEEPYADSSAIPTWYLSEFTKKYATVALSGDGGDENFAGYDRYALFKLFYAYNKLPKSLRKFLTPLGKQVARLMLPNKRKEKALRFLNKLDLPTEEKYLELVSYFSEQEKDLLYNNYFQNFIKNNSLNILRQKFNTALANEYLDKLLYVDFNSYLPDDLMVKTDIASMAHSLEIRSPFLDHHFIELTSKIPSDLKLKRFAKKYILKKALKDLLPKEILNRPKMGFGVPLEHWFRSELKDYVYSVLLSPTAITRNFFKTKSVQEILDKHTLTKTNYANHIWTLLCLELWFKEYF